MTSRLRIVLSGGLAEYSEGGGHWSVFLQYLFGLKALGHEVFWLDLFRSTDDPTRDRKSIEVFFRRFRYYGLQSCAAVVEFVDELPDPDLRSCRMHGMDAPTVIEIAGGADLLWNFCCGMPRSLLPMFRHRVLVDLDPGILQLSALRWDMGIQDHQAFLSVGSKMHDADCEVPTLGVRWHGFSPFVYLPLWKATADPGREAPFSSVTEWTWHTVGLQDRLLSASKRDAYLRYVDLPRRCGRAFQLAANIYTGEDKGDRELLRDHGWQLVDPHRLVKSPANYRQYIQHSRAEIACVKPVYRDLRTGWLSDRSACYLASGRPVLAEDTGFSDHLPTGQGLVTFRDLDEAIAGVAEIDGNYARHQRAARQLAEDLFDSKRQLTSMLRACN